MTFLRTLFWIVVTVLVLLFAEANGTPVTVNLWAGLLMDTRLSFVVVVAFLLGLLPSLIAYYALRWRYRRLLARSEPPTPAPAAGEPAAPLPPA